MIVQDSSTPAPTKQAQGTSGSATSNSFSPPASSLVVVCTAWMFAGTGLHPSSLSVHDNHGNTYLQGAELDNTQECSTAIWIFYYSSPPGATTVTVTCTSTAAASVLIAPQVLTGAASNQAGGGSVTDNDDASMHITTTQSGSYVYCVGAAPTDPRVPVTDATLLQLALYDDKFGTGNQSVAGRLASPTSVPGRTWTGWTAGLAQGCALEILPSPAVVLGTAGTAGASWQTGQVLGSADVNSWILPLAQQKTGSTGRTSTVLTADPDLQVPVIAAGNYAVRGVLICDGPSAANFKFTFAIPPGAQFFYHAAYLNTSGNPVFEAHVAADVVAADTAGAGSLKGVIVDGVLLQGGTPGSLSLLWAQNTQNSSPVNIDQNSYLMAWRMG